MSGSKAPDLMPTNCSCVARSNSSQYSHIVELSSHFVSPSLLHGKTTATHKLSYNGIIGQMFRTDP